MAGKKILSSQVFSTSLRLFFLARSKHFVELIYFLRVYYGIMISYLRSGVHGKSVLIRLNNHVGQTITVRVQGTDTPNYDPRDGGCRKIETIQGL